MYVMSLVFRGKKSRVSHPRWQVSYNARSQGEPEAPALPGVSGQRMCP